MPFGDVVAGSGGTAAAGSFNEISVTFAAAGAGNLLVTCFGVSADAGNITHPDGWTLGDDYSGATTLGGTGWAYKIAAGGETSALWSWDGNHSNRGMAVLEYTGPFDATPLDVQDQDETNVNTTVTTQSSGSITTTAASELLIAFFVGSNASNLDGGRALTNEFVEDIAVFTSPRPAAAINSLVVSSTGTYDTDFSTTESGAPMYGAIAGFKEDVGGGGGGKSGLLLTGVG
jgi:hypothetical protein